MSRSQRSWALAVLSVIVALSTGEAFAGNKYHCVAFQMDSGGVSPIGTIDVDPFDKTVKKIALNPQNDYIACSGTGQPREPGGKPLLHCSMADGAQKPEMRSFKVPGLRNVLRIPVSRVGSPERLSANPLVATSDGADDLTLLLPDSSGTKIYGVSCQKSEAQQRR